MDSSGCIAMCGRFKSDTDNSLKDGMHVKNNNNFVENNFKKILILGREMLRSKGMWRSSVSFKINAIQLD